MLFKNTMHKGLAGLLLIGLCFWLAECSHGGGSGGSRALINMEKIQSQSVMQVTEHYGQSLRGEINGVPVLVLRGSYAEMGEAQGMLAGQDIIQEMNTVLLPYVERQGAGTWESRLMPFAASFTFPERYEQELAGILQGIQQRFPNPNDRMLLALGRKIRLEDLRTLNCIVDIMLAENACSSFSAWGALTADGQVIYGRNLDERYINGQAPFMIMAREPSEANRLATIDIASPGFIGAITPMNAEGWVAMAHDSNGLETASQQWIPRAIVMRNAIESAHAGESAEDIAGLFANQPVRLGSNIHFAEPVAGGANSQSPFVLEWDGNPFDNGVTVRPEDPAIVADAVVCTNHFLRRRPDIPQNTSTSHRLFQIMADALKACRAANQKVDVEKAAQIMNSVARSHAWLTYLTVIGLPAQRKIIFATTPGGETPATRGEWIEITWDQVLNAH
jgi:hypothetical protein